MRRAHAAGRLEAALVAFGLHGFKVELVPRGLQVAALGAGILRRHGRRQARAPAGAWPSRPRSPTGNSSPAALSAACQKRQLLTDSADVTACAHTHARAAFLRLGVHRLVWSADIRSQVVHQHHAAAALQQPVAAPLRVPTARAQVQEISQARPQRASCPWWLLAMGAAGQATDSPTHSRSLRQPARPAPAPGGDRRVHCPAFMTRKTSCRSCKQTALCRVAGA